MSPTAELSALYDQWRSLTEDEGLAITAAAWAQVDQYQAAKARLQPRIAEVSQRMEATTHDARFRPVVEHLMQLERRNNASLAVQRRVAEQEKLELDRTSRNLRLIHKSYIPPVRMNWQSYS